MGIGFSLLLIVLGAVMRYAVSATTSGLNIHTAGGIAMIVGIVGLLASLIMWSMPGGQSRTRRSRVVDSPTGTMREVEDTKTF